MTQKFDNLINGQWVPGVAYTPNINPSNLGDVLGEYTQASVAQLNDAVLAARAAFPAWSTSGIQARADALDKIGNEILARKEELGTLLAREEGKTKPEGIGEAARAGNIFKFFAGECLRLAGETLPSVRPNIGVEVTREPLGVVGIVTPWNFPIAIPAWKVAPALAYGNCVVLKPADLVPGCAWALAEIISRSGIPAGVFNLVMGRGSVIGDPLVNHPGIDAISFTGSQSVGGRIAQQCAVNLKKFQLEMGGKNPQVILDDADLAQAVELSVQSAFFSTGQRCTASSRLIVQDGIHDRFVAMLAERVSALRVGDALDPETQMGPAVSEDQMETSYRYIDIARGEGGRVVTGGERLKLGKPGWYVQPTLIAETGADMRINNEEVFGPVASTIRVKTYEEALAIANGAEFGLSAGIVTTSLRHARDFQRRARAGMVMVNLPTAGVDYHVPFGGTKKSSYGPREQGFAAADFFTQTKTAYSFS